MKKATTEEEILDRTDKWHDKFLDRKISLHEYLGWTWEEYKGYLERGEIPSS